MIAWIGVIAPLIAQLLKAGGTIADLLKAVAPLVPADQRNQIYNAIVAAENDWNAAPGPTP